MLLAVRKELFCGVDYTSSVIQRSGYFLETGLGDSSPARKLITAMRMVRMVSDFVKEAARLATLTPLPSIQTQYSMTRVKEPL